MDSIIKTIEGCFGVIVMRIGDLPDLHPMKDLSR